MFWTQVGSCSYVAVFQGTQMSILDEPMVHTAESFSSTLISVRSLSLRVGTLGTTQATSKLIYIPLIFIFCESIPLIFNYHIVCDNENYMLKLEFFWLDGVLRTQKWSVKERDRIFQEEFHGLTNFNLLPLNNDSLPLILSTKMDGSPIFLLFN